jgi:hypothetical protein
LRPRVAKPGSERCRGVDVVGLLAGHAPNYRQQMGGGLGPAAHLTSLGPERAVGRTRGHYERREQGNEELDAIPHLRDRPFVSQ